MKIINFPVFLIEYNQGKTNVWEDKYVKAEKFKFLFLNKQKEINITEVKENCKNYEDLYNLISNEFETPAQFLKEKLKEIHDNIQKNLDKVNQMKSKIKDSEEENIIGIDSNTINNIASEIRNAKSNNTFKPVNSDEDPLILDTNMSLKSPYENTDSLPNHLEEVYNDDDTLGSPTKLKFSSSSAKSKHKYQSVNNVNVQKEFWKNIFNEAEGRNLEICLLEKYAFSHRRLLENTIKAIEILFRYHPLIFISNSTDLNSVRRGSSEVAEAKKEKNDFIKKVEEQIWSKLWLSKSFLNICLLKLSKLYDEIRKSEKFYLQYNKNLEEDDTENGNFTHFTYSSSSSLDLLNDQKRRNKATGNVGDNNGGNNGSNNESSSVPKRNVDNKSFVRKSIKYWVHPDYVTEVKSIIMRHLPIYVFGDHHDLDHPKNPLISSVYYDNHDLELYHHRLHKSHLAIAFRYRWYGDLKWNHRMSESEYLANQAVNKCEVFAERKTHKEDWTGENSVKERFSIDPSKINDYNRGRYTVEADPISATDDINDEDYYEKNKKLMAKIQLAREIQETIIERQLRPTMRTIYNRTAFQLPDDQRVRVSLDTELTFVREDLKAKKGEWRRDDVGMHWPYRHLKSNEKYLFPYAVLEVKLQTQFGQEPPQWINELTSSYLVEAVPKFSKFMHGCAMLIPEKVKINPYWFYRMYEKNFDLRSPLNRATLRETSLCPVKMPWNIGSVMVGNFDFISPTIRRSITTRSNRIQRPTRREPKVTLANERLFLKYFKIGILVCNVSTVIYYFGNPILGVGYTFGGLLFIIFGFYVYQWREKRIQYNPNAQPLDSIPAIYTLVTVLVLLYIFNLINIYSGRYSTSIQAKLEHIQNHNVIDHRHN